MTFYELLEVPRTISLSRELKKSYEKRLKKLKQEKLSKTEYQEKKKQIKIAYETLSDYHRRHEYDNMVDSLFPSMQKDLFFPIPSLKEIMSNAPTSKNPYFSHSSMQVMNVEDSGEKTVYETSEENKNGTIQKTMKKTLVDKNGNRTELPFTEKEKKMIENNNPFPYFLPKLKSLENK